MAEPRAWEIALWGPSQAGKTMLLAQLFHGSVETGWRRLPTREGEKFIEATGDRFAENRFPPPTAVEGGAKVRYRLQRGDVSIDLAVEDRAGREFTDRAFTTSADRRPARDLLRTADGLVVLLHPTPEPNVLQHQVRMTLQDIFLARGETVDDRPVAVCLSKADQLVETPDDLRLLRDDPEGFVFAKTPPGLDRWVRNFCDRVRFFPVSSVGVRVRYGVIEPVAVRDATLEPRMGAGGTPINLLAPFEWIVAELMGRND